MEKGPAYNELNRNTEALKLLALGAKVNKVAIQVDRGEKWVRDLKRKATGYPAHVVATLPPVVQAYLVSLRPKLKDELEEFKRSAQPQAVSVSSVEEAAARNWYRVRHLERLVKDVDEVRSCLHNPHLEAEAWVGSGSDRPLLLGPGNWALVPTDWVSMTTPDFGGEVLWGDEFAELRKLLEVIGFWQHLDDLRKTAEKLEEDIEEAVQRLGKTDPVLLDVEEWKRMQLTRDILPETTRTPAWPQPDLATTRPPYDNRYAEKVCEALRQGPMPDLFRRLWDLEQKLDQLNKDLAPDKIERLLAESFATD